jgi:hypothetical protein
MVINLGSPVGFEYVTGHVAAPRAPGTRVHVPTRGVKVPPAKPSEKVTVPVGVISTPPLESVTVAVQVVLPNDVNDVGTHETVVVVVRLAAVKANVFELVRWSVSPP